MAIQGYLKSNENGKKPLLIIGNTTTPHGKYLSGKYGHIDSVRFLGGIYNFKVLDDLRHFSSAYFHGHSVGGTNPSLLEAMAAGCFILANDNIFNRSVLKDNAIYYNSPDEVTRILNDEKCFSDKEVLIANNIQRISTHYSWERLVDQHEEYFKELLREHNRK